MSGEPKDNNLISSKNFVEEYQQYGFVELPRGLEVNLLLVTRMKKSESIIFESSFKQVTLQQDCLAIPSVFTYSSWKEIKSINCFSLVSEELMRVISDAEGLVPSKGYRTKRFRHRGIFTQLQAAEIDRMSLELNKNFLEIHNLPDEIDGKEVLTINLYID